MSDTERPPYEPFVREQPSAIRRRQLEQLLTEYLTSAQAAARLGVSVTRVNQLAIAHTLGRVGLPFVMTRWGRLFHRLDVEARAAAATERTDTDADNTDQPMPGMRVPRADDDPPSLPGHPGIGSEGGDVPA